MSKTARSWTIVAVLATVTLVLTIGCRSYGHRQFRAHWNPVRDGRPYSLAYVEIDDRGWLWDVKRDSRSQIEQALTTVRDSVSRGNTVVVLFVHGWHHNASCCDDNTQCFEATLARLDRLLNEGEFLAARKFFHLPERLNIVGIYVGWRGKSLPMPLDYLTFWGRKDAAERVGAGDLRHLLLELQAIYIDQLGATDHFFGWVTVGHSFGGQAVLSAVAQMFEQGLFQRGPTNEVRGLGDLVVLVNPAVEAAAYRHIDALAGQGTFPASQKPILLVVSSRGDTAVRGWFPVGRAAGFALAGRPHLRPGQEEMEYTGLGVFPGQVTHELRWKGPTPSHCDPLPKLVTACGPRSCEGCSWEDREDACESLPPSAPLDPMRYAALVRSDLTADITLAGVELHRTRGAPFSPALVAAADEATVPKHSAIFTRRFVAFLSRYVGLVEAKHLVEFAQREREASAVQR